MFYEHTLDCCEQLFEGEIDQGTFEDQLRFMFGIRAYTLFTIDKVVASVIKQVCSHPFYYLFLFLVVMLMVGFGGIGSSCVIGCEE